MRLSDLKKHMEKDVLVRRAGRVIHLPLFAISEETKEACVGTIGMDGEPVEIWVPFRNIEKPNHRLAKARIQKATELMSG